MSQDRIKAMLEETKRKIAERQKQQLAASGTSAVRPPAPTAGIRPTAPGATLTRPPAPGLQAGSLSAMQASVQARLAALKSAAAGNSEQQQGRPQALILDKKGRMVDAQGREIKITKRTPEFIANIRAEEAEKTKKKTNVLLKDTTKEEEEALKDNPYYDPRLATVHKDRKRKAAFSFHEKGKFEEIAERERTKARLEALQRSIANATKKASISSATRLGLLAAKKQVEKSSIPDVEWWDELILPNNTYDDLSDEPLKLESVTHLIQHPVPIQPPAEPAQPEAIPVMLTKKERKKMRQQRRRAEEKEKQTKIQLGLMEPPAPKVKISNLMRVLGSDAVQDPTKIEGIVRAQMRMRQQKHEEENASRALTKEQRREKKNNKLDEDTSLEVQVCLFRIKDLSNSLNRGKLEMNAKQRHMTGTVLISSEISIVIVEGGPKNMRFYKRLLLKRINWNERRLEDKDGAGAAAMAEDPAGESDGSPNSCALVWEGKVAARAFKFFDVRRCGEDEMRTFLAQRNVPHYFDLAMSDSILASSED